MFGCVPQALAEIHVPLSKNWKIRSIKKRQEKRDMGLKVYGSWEQQKINRIHKLLLEKIIRDLNVNETVKQLQLYFRNESNKLQHIYSFGINSCCIKIKKRWEKLYLSYVGLYSVQFQKQSPRGFCKKRYSYKFRKIHRKTPVPGPFFNKVAGPGL